MKFKTIISIITAVYTTLGFTLLWYSRTVALPTHGGISPHEVVESIIPGGLETVLIIWIALMTLTVITLSREKRF